MGICSIDGFSIVGYKERRVEFMAFDGTLAYKGVKFLHFFDEGRGSGMEVELMATVDHEIYSNCRNQAVIAVDRLVEGYKNEHKINETLVRITKEALYDIDMGVVACCELIEMLIELEYIAKIDKKVFQSAGDNYYLISIHNSASVVEYFYLEGAGQEFNTFTFDAPDYDTAFRKAEAYIRKRGFKNTLGLFVGRGKMDWNLSAVDYITLFSV